MILTREKAYGSYHIIEVEGRIDGLTSSALSKSFEQAAEDGHHTIIVDFSAVSYISSAGLRVFLHMQKKLKPVGGELILLSVQESAMDVFRVSGLHKLFRIIAGLSELNNSEPASVQVSTGDSRPVSSDGVFSWAFREVEPGKYSGIGNSSKLRKGGYKESEVTTISQTELQFALGLASVGESLKDYQSLFGEAMVVNHHFFGYPAVEMPAVDYAWYSKTHPGPVHFLHGLKFEGDYSLCLRFDSPSAVDMLSLARKAAGISGKEFFGIVMVAKSAGIYGLNLRKIPWQDNIPSDQEIMSDANFSDWFDFPVEDTDIHKTLVAAGIYSKSGEDEELHMHAVVFSKGLIGKTGMDVNAELERILHGTEPLRVVHLLEESRFFYGIAGIIAL
ncbi:MAG: STAS domain-containing protein [Bacteroidota bacterium]